MIGRSREAENNGSKIRPRAASGAVAASRPARPLPSGRAVVGGFLVALSALGILLAWSGATAGPTTSYVVAARDLPIGTRLTAADLALVEMDLPPSLASTSAFDDLEGLEGVEVVSALRAGELVQASALVAPGGAPSDLEVSFPVEAERAVGGSLKAGEFIDVLATFGSGADTYTTTVLQSVRVLAISSSNDALGSASARTITVAVATPDDARALTHAVNVAKLMLVRSGDNGTADQGATYRAPAAGPKG